MLQRHHQAEEYAVHHLRRLLREVARGRLGSYLESLHRADVASAMAKLDRDERDAIWQVLSIEKAANVLSHVPEELQQEFVANREASYVGKVMAKMSPDDAVDILGDADEETREILLKELPAPTARRVRQLLNYDENSAGGIMSTDYLSFPNDWTAGQARNYLREEQPARIFYNLYVVDPEGKLLGWTTWQQLCLSPGDMPLVDLIPAKCPTVPVDMPQEDVAHLVSDYDLTAVPVVDVENRLVGTITFDDIMDVLEEEAQEDLLIQAGSQEHELHAPTVLKSVGARVPWLSVTFVGGFMCFLYMSAQEKRLDSALLALLAPFIPVVMAMGGNIGLQAATVSVRQLATGGLDFSGVPSAMWREIRVGVLIGLFFGLVLLGGAGFYLGRFDVVFVAGTAMLSAATAAAVLGFFTPIVFHRFGFDPALASGPLVTIITDILTVVIFFTLAHYTLHGSQSEAPGLASALFP